VLDGEVRPQDVGGPHLRVRDLPQQEVRDAQLAAGADEQVRIGMLGRVEPRRDGRLVDPIGGHTLIDEPLHGVHDLRPAAVVERDGHRAVLAGVGRARGFVHRAADAIGELVQPADDAEADAVRDQRRGLAADRLLEQRHERADLLAGALPVLGGEAVEGDVLDAAVAGRADRPADRLDALAVARDDREVAAAGPAAIAIHDDRDVARYGSGHR
jgi:hypothetical protein